jgi:transcriptional regulator with PAS, ATPase and Fis domain
MGRAAHKLLVGRETRTTGFTIDRHGAPADPEVLGDSPEFRRAIQLARRVAPTDASVFITGESGTGKELVATLIHQSSLRSNRPLVAVNCAALPETLLESEMFGHVKGAFTGAVRDKMGLLEAANGGTMFLDELLEMPKSIQAKLLRAIQDGVVRRLGSERSDATVNVRFIAATNGSPEQAVASGALREDLYYRLQVVPIHLPPLRERQDDIPLLANSFLSHYWRLHRGDAPAPRLSPATLHRLRAHPWRGNVRELQNVFEHAVVLLEPRAEIQPSELPLLRHSTPPPERIAEQVAVRMAQQGLATPEPVAAQAETGPSTADGDSRWREEPYHAARDRLISDFERRYLLWLVNHTAGNLTKAARIAGVERTTLYRMMERHGLQRMTVTVSVE